MRVTLESNWGQTMPEHTLLFESCPPPQHQSVAHHSHMSISTDPGRSTGIRLSGVRYTYRHCKMRKGSDRATAVNLSQFLPHRQRPSMPKSHNRALTPCSTLTLIHTCSYSSKIQLCSNVVLEPPGILLESVHCRELCARTDLQTRQCRMLCSSEPSA